MNEGTGLQLPPELAALRRRSCTDVSGRSSAKTYRFEDGLFLKVDEAGALKREYRMTRFFHDCGFGVRTLDYVTSGCDYLLTAAAEGSDLLSLTERPETLCRVLAEALKRLHKQNCRGVPLSSRMERYFEAAEGDPDRCQCDGSVLMKRWPVGSKEEAWQILQKNRKLLKCDTLIHGDACLPNLIHRDGRFVSFIDEGMAGLGDRHVDLYWALWSLQYNLRTEEYGDLFLSFYGRENCCEEVLRTIAAFEYFG